MFASESAGIKVEPGHPLYRGLSRGFNPRWAAEPDYIRIVSSAEETREALQAALRERADPGRDRITVRSGGHAYEDFVCAPDVRVIIDVAPMNRIHHDPAMDAVCIESGATNGDIDRDLVKGLGLLLPGGSCPTVGAGGHITGGGFGLFSRQHGLTVDYLYAVEVAVVGARRNVELVTARRDDGDDGLRELWWAHTGGGGGNFGIVTKYWFRDLPPAPRHILRAEAGWPWAHMDESAFREIVHNFGTFFRDHQEPGDPLAGMFGILLLTHSSSKQVGLITQIDAGLPDAEDALREFTGRIDTPSHVDLTDLEEPHGDHPLLVGSREPQSVPWTVVPRIAGLWTNNDKAGKYKSAYLREPMPDDQVGAAWRRLSARPDVPREAVVQVDSYGSAINRPPYDTAVAQRDSVLKLQHQVYWPECGSGEPHLAWIRALYSEMYAGTGGVPVPGTATDGCYVNYPDVDLGDPEWNTSGTSWAELYYKEHYPRLQQVKTQWDPGDVFRHAQSIRPLV
jgi:hypothetical protein